MTVAVARPPLAVSTLDLHPVILGPCRCLGCGTQVIWCGLAWHGAAARVSGFTHEHRCPKAGA